MACTSYTEYIIGVLVLAPFLEKSNTYNNNKSTLNNNTVNNTILYFINVYGTGTLVVLLRTIKVKKIYT